jgi:hypothetical protein
MQIELAQEIADWLFLLIMLNCGYFIVITIAILFMHFLMPSAVLDKYFKPPYFRDMERLLFTGFPYAPMRTIMFMRAIAYPDSGKRRGVTEAHLLVPPWYRLLSKITVISIVLSFIVMIIFLVAVGVIYMVAG